MSKTELPSRVALLSSGPPLSLKVLYCLRQLGIETDIIDIGTRSIASFSRYRRKYHRLYIPGDSSTSFPQDCLDRLQEITMCNEITGIVGGDIRSSGLLHSIKDKLIDVLVFPCIDGETLEMLDDKWRFQKFMMENAIPCPEGVLLGSIDQLESLTKDLTFPLMVKPLFGESGHGIVYKRNLQDLREHLHSASKYTALPVLIQRYVDGIDADISLLALNGRVVCHALHSRVDGGILRFQRNDEILATATQIVKAANYSGVLNIDVRISLDLSHRVSVIECNPRFWYTLQASLWRGLNFVEAGFRVAAGDEKVFQSPTDGAYYLHGYLLRKVLLNPGIWRSVDAYNWKGFLQAFSDPLPFLAGRFH
jgi:predicted ATP-grasp superfamily ATP-dependent carboligase